MKVPTSQPGVQIVLTGDLRPGADRAAAVAVLVRLLKVTPAQAEVALNGHPRRLKDLLTRDRAEQIRDRLAVLGIPCRIEDGVPLQVQVPEPSGGLGGLELQAVMQRCPACGEDQPPAPLCRRCGAAVEKLREQASGGPRAARPKPAAASLGRRFPYRLVNQLLTLVFLSALGLAIWSHWKRDQLPPPDFYDLARLSEPAQTPTSSKPFQVESQGVTYTIDPLFDYALDGVVVSLHDSDAFTDVYHFKDWKDFLNIRDLCVVWDPNVGSGVFRAMDYHNTTWTCWIAGLDGSASAAFARDALSNNHLLSHDPRVQAAIRSARRGDQIHFRGLLASYSHAGGFHRGSSTTRTDTGNGACETVFVQDFEVVRRANPGWHLTYSLAKYTTIAALAGLLVLLGVAPVTRSG
jgi:hypothetical protein